MSLSAINRTKLHALAGLTAAAVGGIAALGLGATPASAVTGTQVVNIANANLGKGYCSTNSAGGIGFDSSCSANGGTGEYWCGDFVSWVWQQAGLPVPASNPASVPSWMSTPGYHAIGSGYTPQPGDAVVFGDDNYPTQGSHIALVTSYSNGLLSDIGGDENGGGSPWWSTSIVQTDEGNGAAWNPSNKLFAGTSYEMWVIGYVSAGASTSGGSVPAGFNVAIDAGGAALASGQTVSGAVNLTAMASSQGVINSLTYTITGPNGTQTIDGGTGADNYAETWNTSGLPNGSYTISVTANEIDGQNHTYPASPISFTVNNGSHSGGLAALGNARYEKSFRASDGTLWLATGSGNMIAAATNPLQLGVSAGTKPSTATLADGSSVTAFRGNDGYLWIATGNGATISAAGEPGLLGVAAGTSPSITALPNGGWEVAFTANDGTLWLATGSGDSVTAATNPMKLGVNSGSSPSLTTLPNGNFEVAFKANDGTLWLATGNGTTITADANPLALGVQGTTTPSVTTLPNGNYEVAFTGTDGTLWMATGSGATIASATNPMKLGVNAGSSPSLTTLPNGNFEVAFNANDGTLWLATGNGTTITADTNPMKLGVAGGSSPDLVTLTDNGFEVAFKANDGTLWLATGNGTTITADGNPLALGVA